MKPLYSIAFSILSILLLVLIESCTCPECESFPEPLMLMFIDNNDLDLLASGELVIDNIKSCSSNFIDYNIESFVTSDSISRQIVLFNSLNTNCITEACCGIIEFTNGDLDTFNYQINEVNTKCCTGYNTRLFEYNGIDLTDRRENSFGAFEIVK